jgi:hypothetical protein
MRRALLVACAVLGAAGCSVGGSSPSGGSATQSVSTSDAEHPSLALEDCPVTPPGGPRPPRGLPPAPYTGDGQLWVGLWRRGLVVVPPDDIGRRGVLGMKFMWNRGPDVRGMLHITGSQLDGDGAVRGRTAGYGLTGFNPSAIYFTQQGCYRVTGRAGGANLSFVTLVRTCSVLPELPTRRRQALTKSWCPA